MDQAVLMLFGADTVAGCVAVSSGHVGQMVGQAPGGRDRAGSCIDYNKFHDATFRTTERLPPYARPPIPDRPPAPADRLVVGDVDRRGGERGGPLVREDAALGPPPAPRRRRCRRFSAAVAGDRERRRGFGPIASLPVCTSTATRIERRIIDRRPSAPAGLPAIPTRAAIGSFHEPRWIVPPRSNDSFYPVLFFFITCLSRLRSKSFGMSLFCFPGVRSASGVMAGTAAPPRPSSADLSPWRYDGGRLRDSLAAQDRWPNRPLMFRSTLPAGDLRVAVWVSVATVETSC